MGNIHTLTDAVDFTQLIPPASRSAGAVTGTTYSDMSGWEGGAILLSVGAITSTGTIDLAVKQATDSSGTGSKALTGASLVQIADTGGSKLYAVEFRTGQLDLANGFKFVQVTLTTGTAANISDAVLIRHRGRSLPVSTSLTQQVKV